MIKFGRKSIYFRTNCVILNFSSPLFFSFLGEMSKILSDKKYRAKRKKMIVLPNYLLSKWSTSFLFSPAKEVGRGLLRGRRVNKRKVGIYLFIHKLSMYVTKNGVSKYTGLAPSLCPYTL